MFEELAVHGAPDEIAGLLAERYGDTVDRVGLSMPFDTTRETLEALVAGFHDPKPRHRRPTTTPIRKGR